MKLNINTNRLDHVSDNAPAGNYTEDIDNQTAGNYDYDAIGNLVKGNTIYLKERR